MATPSIAARGWGLTASGLALIAVCYGLARFAYGLFLPAFRDAFHLSGTLSGVIAGGSFGAYCFTVIAAALGVARLGPRRVAVAAGVLAATGMTLVATAHGATMLAIGVLVAGASTGVASPPLAEAIERWGPAGHHDRAQAVVNAGPAVGIVVSGPVALLALGHWRLAWAAFAVIAVAVTCWISIAIPDTPRPASPGTAAIGRLAAVARARGSWPAMAAAAVFGATSSAVWSFGRDLVVSGGMSPTASVGLWVILGAAELAGLAAGDLIARFGLARIWTVSLAFLGGATAGLGLLPGSVAAAVISIVAFGAAYVTLTTVIFFWMTRMHPHDTASAVALGFLMISAGQALASPLVGVLTDQASPAAAFTVCAALGAIGATALRPRLRT